MGTDTSLRHGGQELAECGRAILELIAVIREGTWDTDPMRANARTVAALRQVTDPALQGDMLAVAGLIYGYRAELAEYLAEEDGIVRLDHARRVRKGGHR
jgi:hypothetical protein